MIVRLFVRLEIEAQSQICSHQTFYIKKFVTLQLLGVFRSSCFLYFKSHTYNDSINSQHALISPKL